MQRLLLIVSLMLLPTLGFAASEGGSHKFEVFGVYGLGIINPSDVNNIQKQFVPKPSDISSSTVFGGGAGIMLSPKFHFRATYEVVNAKNLNSGSGIELNSNFIFGDINYMLIHTGSMYVYVGAGVGYPTYSHATTNILGVKSEFDADKTVGFEGQGGLGFMLGRHVSLFFQGGYQSLVSGDVKTSAGVALTTPTGTKAKIDLSGFVGLAGLSLMF